MYLQNLFNFCDKTIVCNMEDRITTDSLQYKPLLVCLHKASNDLAATHRIVKPRIVIAGPAIVAALQTLPEFIMDPYEPDTSDGAHRVGRCGPFTIFRNINIGKYAIVSANGTNDDHIDSFAEMENCRLVCVTGI